MLSKKSCAIALGAVLVAAYPLAAQPFALDVRKDVVICGAELAGEVVHLLYDHFVIDDTWDGRRFSKDDVNVFDRALMHGYDSALDTAGDLLAVSTAAVPFLTTAVALCADDGYACSDLLTETVMYAETMAVAHTVAHITKGLVLRTRPYLYYDVDEAPEDDWNRSFYSGHTTMSFAAATFVGYTFCNYFPESPWRVPVIVAGYTLATATAMLRVRAGCHFATDVLVGAVAGTAIGFLVPWCHRLGDSRTQFSVTPLGFSVRRRFL